jgi:hypothetical protein
VIREAIAVTRVITNAPMALDPIRITLHASRKTINDFSVSVLSRPRAKSRQANDRPGADPGRIRWDQTHGENWCCKTLCVDCRQMLVITCVRTEVLIHRPILKHVVDSREDGSSDGHDSLLRTAPGFETAAVVAQ